MAHQGCQSIINASLGTCIANQIAEGFGGRALSLEKNVTRCLITLEWIFFPYVIH